MSSLYLNGFVKNSIPRSIVNAARIRHFAKSRGLLAKTDKIDASLIACYAKAFCVKHTPAPSATERELSALVNRRRDLQAQRTAEKNVFSI